MSKRELKALTRALADAQQREDEAISEAAHFKEINSYNIKKVIDLENANARLTKDADDFADEVKDLKQALADAKNDTDFFKKGSREWQKDYKDLQEQYRKKQNLVKSLRTRIEALERALAAEKGADV